MIQKINKNISKLQTHLYVFPSLKFSLQFFFLFLFSFIWIKTGSRWKIKYSNEIQSTTNCSTSDETNAETFFVLFIR